MFKKNCLVLKHFSFAYQLHKPEDETYSEFWVDFNTGSQRITLFCNQENPDLQVRVCDIYLYIRKFYQKNPNFGWSQSTLIYSGE